MPTVDPKIMELAIEVAEKSKPESDSRIHISKSILTPLPHL